MQIRLCYSSAVCALGETGGKYSFKSAERRKRENK
jgi:hypothetical protein